MVDKVDKVDKVDNNELYSLNDEWRRKSLRYELRFYDRETGDTIGISPKSLTVITTDVIEKNGPFKIGRFEWFKRAHDAIIREVITSAIDRYGHRFGIDKPPGENTGTIDFEIIEIEQIEKVPLPPECPEPVKENLVFLEELRSKYTGRDREVVENLISIVLNEYPECRTYYDGIRM